MSLLPPKVTLMSVSTSNTYMKLQNFRKLGKNAKLSKKRTLPISGQNLFPQRCPLIRDYTVILKSLQNTSEAAISHRRCSVKKDVLKNLANFIGKQLCWSLSLIKLQARNFIKKRLQHRCFPVKCAKNLGTYILKNICKWLLLILQEELLNSFSRLLYFNECL